MTLTVWVWGCVSDRNWAWWTLTDVDSLFPEKMHRLDSHHSSTLGQKQAKISIPPLLFLFFFFLQKKQRSKYLFCIFMTLVVISKTYIFRLYPLLTNITETTHFIRCQPHIDSPPLLQGSASYQRADSRFVNSVHRGFRLPSQTCLQHYLH